MCVVIHESITMSTKEKTSGATNMPTRNGQSIMVEASTLGSKWYQKKYTQLISAQGVAGKVNTYEHGWKTLVKAKLVSP